MTESFNINYHLLSLPIVGALIGWLTNYIAVKLLFRPQRVYKFLGIEIQGLLPKRKRELSRSIAHTVETHMLNTRDFSNVLKEMEFEEEIKEAVEEILKRRLKIHWAGRLPMIGKLSDKIAHKLKDVIVKEMIDAVHQYKDRLIEKFHSRINLQKMIIERLENYDIMKLEEIILKLVSKELRYIELTGAVLGFMIGALQVVYAVVFS